MTGLSVLDPRVIVAEGSRSDSRQLAVLELEGQHEPLVTRKF